MNSFDGYQIRSLGVSLGLRITAADIADAVSLRAYSNFIFVLNDLRAMQ